MTCRSVCALAALVLLVGCGSGKHYPLSGDEVHEGDAVQRMHVPFSLLL